ncbi:MAG: hypothetical protein LBR37_02215 [Erysipelotrichaceae bacterium]|nr:hypothetical protein [Erysipelotrichaceae bacterium]
MKKGLKIWSSLPLMLSFFFVLTSCVDTVLVDAETPTVSNLSGATYVRDEVAAALSVEASISDGGVLSYQWYQNTEDQTTGAEVIGTNSDNYLPSTAVIGTTYYYVIVTNTNDEVTGANTASHTSNTVAITVTEVPNPFSLEDGVYIFESHRITINDEPYDGSDFDGYLQEQMWVTLKEGKLTAENDSHVFYDASDYTIDAITGAITITDPINLYPGSPADTLVACTSSDSKLLIAQSFTYNEDRVTINHVFEKTLVPQLAAPQAEINEIDGAYIASWTYDEDASYYQALIINTDTTEIMRNNLYNNYYEVVDGIASLPIDGLLGSYIFMIRAMGDRTHHITSPWSSEIPYLFIKSYELDDGIYRYQNHSVTVNDLPFYGSEDFALTTLAVTLSNGLLTAESSDPWKFYEDAPYSIEDDGDFVISQDVNLPAYAPAGTNTFLRSQDGMIVVILTFLVEEGNLGLVVVTHLLAKSSS